MDNAITVFLKTNYFVILYALTLWVALVNYRKYYDSKLKYFPILIAYTLATEILGWFILEYEEFQIVYRNLSRDEAINNASIYNIFDIIFYLYFYYVYWKSTDKIFLKKIMFYGAAVFILVSIINVFFQNFWMLPQLYAVSTGSIILIIGILMYLATLRKRGNPVRLRHNLLFWISLGLLLFYPFYPLFLIIGVHYSDLYSSFFGVIHRALIAAMYSCFIAGFVFLKRFR